MNFKCQNCGSPLTVEEGKDRATCVYCQSENLITVGADGQITLSLVQKIDSIDNKADHILAGQNAALNHAQQLQNLTAAGHLLQTTTSEYHHFLEADFKPQMVMLEEEKGKVGICFGGCGCLGMLIGAPIVASIAAAMLASAGEAVANITWFVVCVAVIVGVFALAKSSRNSIQARMDALIQRKCNFETKIEELKRSITPGM